MYLLLLLLIDLQTLHRGAAQLVVARIPSTAALRTRRSRRPCIVLLTLFSQLLGDGQFSPLSSAVPQKSSECSSALLRPGPGILEGSLS